MPAAEVVGDTAQAVAPLVDSSTEIIPILNQMRKTCSRSSTLSPLCLRCFWFSLFCIWL